jgi:hypothetical protein
MPEIISRKEALARGLKRYFTGKPCRNAHISERLVKLSHCVTCSRIRYRRNHTPEKMKKWRQSAAYKERMIKTKHKRTASYRAWWAANAERNNALKRAYYERNKSEILKRRRERNEADPEILRKYFREKAREYRAKNPEAFRERARERAAKWRRENREKALQIQRRSRMRSYFRVEERVVNSNPKGERQWLSKNQVLLRRLRRKLRNRNRQDCEAPQS